MSRAVVKNTEHRINKITIMPQKSMLRRREHTICCKTWLYFNFTVIVWVFTIFVLENFHPQQLYHATLTSKETQPIGK